MWPFLNEKRGSEAEPDADSLRRRPLRFAALVADTREKAASSRTGWMTRNRTIRRTPALGRMWTDPAHRPGNRSGQSGITAPFSTRDPGRSRPVPADFGFVPTVAGTIPGDRPLMSLSFPAVSPCPRVPRVVERQRTTQRPDEPNQRSAPVSRKTPTLCLQEKRHRTADWRGRGTTCHCLRDSRGTWGHGDISELPCPINGLPPVSVPGQPGTCRGQVRISRFPRPVASDFGRIFPDSSAS